ncbi:MAG: ribonucleoside-diphosphate reductase, adenosylcobalamin-dependent [Euryarchaeota archaeon RBG_13_57_23]|nr:MAG: ribonucleoside-diphosphate reductase, adenosylcobalamin-dependent [Euryarchaeota archaeon RBG_13_57_23]
MTGHSRGNTVALNNRSSSNSHGWALEPQITANAKVVLERRYLKKDENGKIVETSRGLFERVAKAIASAERNYGKSDSEVERTAERFYEMMARLEFMPNSPTLMNAGKELGQLSACFVLPIGDSMEEIFDAIKYTALIHKCLVPETLVMTDCGCRKLGSISSGQWIETHEGMDLVDSRHDNGVQDVFSVETEEGNRIVGTALHRLMTRSATGELSWKTIGQLRPGDKLVMKLGGWLGGENRSVPEQLYMFAESGVDDGLIGVDEKSLCSYLRRVFTENGWISPAGVVCVEVGSERLAAELQSILFYLGIPSNREALRLTLSTRSAFMTFKEKVGFDSLVLSKRLAESETDVMVEELEATGQLHEEPDDEGHYYVAVREVVSAGRREVVDLTIPGKHAYLANGFVSHNSGGGTGFSFSRLRPANDMVKSTAGVSSGPISFMEVFNAATETIKQGGTRRGANMGILRVDHPDILEFITCKRDSTKLTNFNISVALTDIFMKAVEEEGEYDLLNPRSRQPVRKMKARKVFDLIVNMAWRNGEPGIVFLDRINRDNPTPKLGEIESTNPCGEQPLLPYESCNLGSINLAKMLTHKDGRPSVDWERLRGTVRLSVRFLDNVIDVNRYPLKQIEEMTKANRKIGLGVMGFADMLLRLGVPYDTEEAMKLGRDIMKFINDEGHKMSVELAEERGSFPSFAQSTLADRYKNIRNATVTTIAPTGTISIISAVSSGIEPIFAVAYVRNVMDKDILPEVNPIFEEVARERGFYTDELMKEIAAKGSLKEMKMVPEDVGRLFVTALDISPQWHIRMQATFQEHTDNAVSKTVNFPKDATQKDVENVYMQAFELGCKGVTVYRYGSREDQVLSVGEGPKEPKAKEGEAEEEDASRLPRARPYVTRGSTQRIETGCGHLYVTINEDERGLCEVFTQMGKSGGCTASQAEAVGRLISLALRSGIEPEAIVKQLKGIRCPSPLWQPGGMVLSCSDAVAKALERFVKDRPELTGEGGTKAASAGEEVAVKQNYVSKGDVCPECPECGSMVEYVEGCVVCRTCGFSKCW